MSDRPNIILINCDDLGYGDLGCYGSTINSTPHLDRMAAEGMRFTDFYMASSICSPSRAAMLTGCQPPRIGLKKVLFPGEDIGLDPTEITFARLLQDQGYATQIVGKWHCGDQPEFLPTRHGFDHYYGVPYSNDMGRQVKADGGIKERPPLPLVRDEDVIQAQPDQATLTERYTEEAVRFIRENRDGPFLLYYAHMYVHLPLYVQERFAKESQNGRYGAAVAAIDWATGVILDELKTQGIDDNTLVIFTSDNGSRVNDEGGSNAPLRGVKHTPWEGGIRLPMIARWPGRVPAGTTNSGLCSAMDFLPTFAALAGTKPAADRAIDGIDISSILVDAELASPRRSLPIYQFDNLAAIRDERWKLFFCRFTPQTGHHAVHELYDLHNDIGETTNVVDDHPEVVACLRAEADRVRADTGDASRGIDGPGCRPVGRVESPQPMTTFDPDHPYYMTEYDLAEAG